MRNRSRLLVVLASLALAPVACRRRQAEPPAQPAQPAAPTGIALVQGAPQGTVTQTLQGLEVRTNAATVFRHTDGNWHVRVHLEVRNPGAAPVDLRRESFRVDEMGTANDHATFPEHVTVNPAMTVSGDLAWYRNAADTQPQSFTVKYQPGGDEAPVLAQQAYAPVFAPTEPAPGVAPATAVFTLPVTAAPGLTFVHSDGNRHFRVSVTVRNTTTVPLRVYREHFTLKLGETEAGHAGQEELTTWAQPTVIAPGASATGALGYYMNGDPAPNPPSVRLLFGPTSSPQADLTVPVAAGPSPLP